MQVSRSIRSEAFAAEVTRWMTAEDETFLWYSQEDNSVSLKIYDTSVSIVIRVTTENATYSIKIYCTSVVDLGEYVKESAPDGSLSVTFLEDDEEVGTWSGNIRYGFYPTEIVIPPPFIPYHDGDDMVAIPMVATTPDGCFEAKTPDGSYSWEAGSNMETITTLAGGYGLLWRVEGTTDWRYSQPLKIQNECETANLLWYSRNGLGKRWVFEVSSITSEIADPVEIITDRGIGLKRIGAPSRTMTIRTAGCNVYTRKWLSDIAISPELYMYRRYYGDNDILMQTLIPVTCEAVDIDLSEKVADFEAVINVERGRTL